MNVIKYFIYGTLAGEKSLHDYVFPKIPILRAATP